VSATPFSYRQYAGNGSTTTFSVPFPYLLKAHVKVYLGFNILDGTFSSELADGVGFSWTSSSQIQATTAPASGQVLTVIRQTPNNTRLVDWQDGSVLISDDLDTSDLQNLYVVQEQQDRNDAGITQSTTAITTANSAVTTAGNAVATANSANAEVLNRWSKVTETINSGDTWAGNNTKVPTTGAVDGRIDAKIDAALIGDIAAGTDLSIADNSPGAGQITISHNVAGANVATANTNGNVLRNITVSAQGHVTGVSSFNLDDRYYTESEADAKYVGLTGAQSVAGVKTFTSSPVVPVPSGATDAANKSYVDAYGWNKTSDTIASNEVWVNGDSNIPTTAAVTGRIVDLLNDIGSYVVVATEVTFPNSGVVDGAGQPDAGVLVEITDASGLAWDGAGTSTNATRANSSAVTITGITGTSPISGCGAQLLSTSTLHTYTFVKWTIASGVAQTISDNISEILQVDSNAAAAAASATAAAASQSAAASSASAAASSASSAATSATNAANSASAASSLVTTITNLSYLLNWGLITEAAGTSSDYGAL
jgi:hypothetical protein